MQHSTKEYKESTFLIDIFHDAKCKIREKLWWIKGAVEVLDAQDGYRHYSYQSINEKNKKLIKGTIKEIAENMLILHVIMIILGCNQSKVEDKMQFIFSNYCYPEHDDKDDINFELEIKNEYTKYLTDVKKIKKSGFKRLAEEIKEAKSKFTVADVEQESFSAKLWLTIFFEKNLHGKTELQNYLKDSVLDKISIEKEEKLSDIFWQPSPDDLLPYDLFEQELIDREESFKDELMQSFYNDN